jgi:hypothetical protein
VQNVALRIGRTESILECTGGSYGRHLEITLINGDVDANHPFYQTLKNAGIDKRVDVSDHIWGIITLTATDYLGGCGTFDYNNNPVGAQQIGNQIKLSLFHGNGEFRCAGGIYKVK